MPDQNKIDDDKAFDRFLAHYSSIHDIHRPDIAYQDELAASTTGLMINALIFANAGALVALSQLKDAVERQSLWLASLCLIVGLVLALIVGACQIWNARTISAVYRQRMNAQMAAAVKDSGKGTVDEVELRREAEKGPLRQRTIKVTLAAGWGAGLCSVLAFVVAAGILMAGSFETPKLSIKTAAPVPTLNTSP